MGWKSSICLTREEAIRAIEKALNKKPYDEMSNEELEQMMYGLEIGDKPDLPYYGNNFWVFDSKKDFPKD